MKKKTIILTSLILTILSLIYVILNYFGLIRYTSIYTYPIEDYSKQYKNLDKIGTHKTVISLTSTTNLDNLTNVIKSLLDQTVKVDLISINIPNKQTYDLPKNLTSSVALIKCGEDNGVLNSLLPVLLKESENTTKIITLGTNTIYGKDFIETLLETLNNNNNKIVYSNNNSNDLDLTKGVVFSTKFFKENIFNKPSKTTQSNWINQYFKNFPKINIKYTENYKCL